MSFHDLDLNLLITLDALLTEKNVTRAGQHIHLSQPATSAGLARLRQYFKDELLVPAGRKMVLTPLAQSLVQPVRSCLLQIQHTVTSKAEFDPASSNRKFCLAASNYVTSVLLPQALQEATRQAPGIRFELLSLEGELEDQLEKGEIDFLIRPSVFALPAHPKEVLLQETHTCVAWTRNSLIAKTISRKQYLSIGHVAVHVGKRPVFFEQWFATRYGQIRNVELVTQNFEAACRFVVGTNRIATVLTRVAKLCAEYLPLKLIAPPIAIPRTTEVLQWHRYHDLDPGHIWLRAILKRSANQLMLLPNRPGSPTGSNSPIEN